MSDKEKVPQFWDKGIQLVDGCSHVSPGCANCWSEAMTARFKRVPEVLTGDRFNGTVQFNLHLLEKAAQVKKPTVYAIWNDLYHEGITRKQIEDAHYQIIDNPRHTFLIVTKRPERAAQHFEEAEFDYGPFDLPSHIWHVVTCENQAMADERIPHLLRIPGKRAIIIEPMLEGIIFPGWSQSMHPNGHLSGIHQVILGPENGPGKRPFDPVWAESVKAQCEAAGVPFYRKDTGEGILAWK